MVFLNSVPGFTTVKQTKMQTIAPDLVEFVFTCGSDYNNTFTDTRLLRAFLHQTIGNKSKTWRCKVLAVDRKQTDRVVVYDVLTQESSHNIQCARLMETMNKHETMLGVTEAIQLHDGTLLLLTGVDLFYAYKSLETRMIELDPFELACCAVELSNGKVAIATKKRVIIYNSLWETNQILEIRDVNHLLELPDGRLVSAGAQATVWKITGKQYVLDVQHGDLITEYYRKIWYWSPNVMLVQTSDDNRCLWDLETNKISPAKVPSVDEATIVSAGKHLFAMMYDKIQDLRTNKVVEIAEKDGAATTWPGAVCAIGENLIAWPTYYLDIVVYDVKKENIVQRYNVRDYNLSVRAFLFD
jgi:hypothetical protein